MTAVARFTQAAGQSAAGFFMPKNQDNQPAVLSTSGQIALHTQGNTMNQIEDDELDEDDDELDYDDYGDLLSEDQWDNSPKAQALIAAMPKGWVMVKAINFTRQSLVGMDDWLKNNSKNKYKRVGFSSGCSTNVGVQFENYVDAVMFKLRWR